MAKQQNKKVVEEVVSNKRASNKVVGRREFDAVTAMNVVAKAKCKIDGRLIKLPKGGVGISTWGALDFLKNKANMVVVMAEL